MASECLRDGVGNGIWPKDISYNLIAISERVWKLATGPWCLKNQD